MTGGGDLVRDAAASGAGTASRKDRPGLIWKIRGGTLSLDRPRVMGVLNLTPDSFSDGGQLPTVEAALRQGEQMMAEGASILDVGGESTRPGASAVPPREELRRVLPTIAALVRHLPLPVSIDTRKAEVARAALEAGASIVNDVSGLAFDLRLGTQVASSGAGLVLMHMRGTPEEMATRTDYRNVGEEVARELEEGGLRRAEAAGIQPEQVVLDPGLGFAKTPAQSLELLRDLTPLRSLGRPLLIGPSRKSFLGQVLGVPPEERVVGSAAACVLAWVQGVRIFRTHDVGATLHALAVAEAVAAGSWERGRSLLPVPKGVAG